MMKVMFFVGVLVMAVTGSASQAEHHLNSMLETFPPSPSLIQMEATMLSCTSIDVRDEIAALLYKMQKDIQLEEKQESLKDRNTQNNCDTSARKRIRNIKFFKSRRESQIIKKNQHHNNQKIIPNKVLRKEKKIRDTKAKILKAEASIKKAQIDRDAAHTLYLRNMADFNKALDDIDKLRTLVNTGLNNRGQGANSDDARHTQSPTAPVITAPPTKEAYDRKNTHGKVEAGKFIELSNENLAHLSRDEAVQSMRGIYSNLKNTVDTNPMVLAVVGTLDATMTQIEKGGNTVDKIRSLLLQVRNELQKSKREQLQAETIAVANWKDTKLKLRNAVNTLRILWADIYEEKANLWRKYGNQWTQEGQAMRKMSMYKKKHDRNVINLAFEKVTCKTQHDNFKRSSKQRNGQLKQIEKALKLLAKFGLGGKYGKMVRESIKDINVGLCRAFDDNSTYVSIADKHTFHKKATGKVGFSEKAWKVYPNRDQNDEKYICVSKIQFTFTCKNKCQILSSDKRLPKPKKGKWPIVGEMNGSKKSRTFTTRFPKPMKFKKFKNLAIKYKGVVRRDVSIFVVPGCNCRENRNADLDVKAGLAKKIAITAPPTAATASPTISQTKSPVSR